MALRAACAIGAAITVAAHAQAPQPQLESIEVTATKIAEDVILVPASVTVIDGDDIRARNANDLQSALALVAGVSVAPGGDGGPAGNVPEMWGLREFDAFLLVVDGVPWGGAFNPDTPTLNLQNLDRIEVVRGAAPVMYGATSFVGVIHVIHREAGSPWMARVSAGDHRSGAAAVSVPITQTQDLRQSVNLDYEKRGFRDPATSFDRAHLLYRLASAMAGGTLRFDGDVSVLHQNPASPHPWDGRVLSRDVLIDTNYNPSNGKIDANRYHGVLGFDGKAGAMPWTTTVALTRSDFDIVRGFLSDISNTDPNVAGFQQRRNVTDIYFDTHLVKQISGPLRVIAGFDHLYGKGEAKSGLFDIFVPLNSRSRPHSPEPDERTHVTDTRNFSGFYAATEWMAIPSLRVDAGLRLNHTSEKRRGEARGPDGAQTASGARTFTRLSGTIGANWQLWSRDRDVLALYGDYRQTFKPAAIDFGPEAEGEILDPETAHSVEAGAKGRLLGGRLTWDASAFQMDFSNLVVATLVHGLPALENGGRERFRGAELETDYGFLDELHWELGYSYHDARFRDYVRNFGGQLTQLSGKRLEMTPFNLLNTGIVLSKKNGFNGNVIANYVGQRFLNKRNTAIARAYTTWSAGIGYRIQRGEFRVDGHNLSNERPPVAESELGDAQYYLLPARSWEVSYRMNF
ncbi:MAG: TonB-dependent siderophore receptor [Thermoanaerobaculia bacterium]